jgi:hypothetical protein
MVAELAAELLDSQHLAASATHALCAVPQASARAADKSVVEVVEQANAPAASRAQQAQARAYRPALSPTERNDNGAARRQMESEAVPVEPKRTHPRVAQIKLER